MPTIWDDPARTALIARFRTLSADTKPAWGRFSAPAMVQHCLDALRMTLGEISVKPNGAVLRFPPVRHAIIYWLPFPKGAPTAPELLAPPKGDFPALLDSLEQALGRMAARSRSGGFTPHPAFGSLSNKDVGVLTHKHLDHHLRQFRA
jgi:hypothetical protein